MDSKNIHPAGQKAQAPRFTRQLVAHTNGFKVWLKETDSDTIGRFVAEREADDQGVVWAMFCEIQKAWNAHDELLSTITRAQAVLANHIAPTGIIADEAILRLLGILDDQELVKLVADLKGGDRG